MHYNGPIIRPQTDAYSLFVEVTVGCTHNSCTFCNFYDGYPFRVAPLEQIEEDLLPAFFDSIKTAITDSGIDPADIIGFGFSSQGSIIGLLDENGDLIRPWVG